MTGLAILGSTGSIGQSTLNVVRRQRRFRVVALTADQSAEALAAQVAEFRPAMHGLVVRDGPACLIAAATHPEVQVVVNAVVGAAGLEATLAALEAGKRVALANKESLVTAGELVLEAAARGGGLIVPIDSEHSAVLQCLAGGGRETLTRLTLTASGGPFRAWTPDQVAAATVSEALNHPTWAMGRKISVDSATLANKALEVIEAHHLFGLGYDAIHVVVHPQSIIHALCEFSDGSVLAQLGFPTMELPILYALTHPERLPDGGVRRFDPVAAGSLTFEPVRHDAFPTFALGVAAGRAGGTAPTVFNAANEVAVQAFLDGRVAFGRIPAVIEQALAAHTPVPADRLETVRQVDQWARVAAEVACC